MEFLNEASVMKYVNADAQELTVLYYNLLYAN
jgi:hypothetical protein